LHDDRWEPDALEEPLRAIVAIRDEHRDRSRGFHRGTAIGEPWGGEVDSSGDELERLEVRSCTPYGASGRHTARGSPAAMHLLFFAPGLDGVQMNATMAFK
jgi:hypothetical protein